MLKSGFGYRAAESEVAVFKSQTTRVDERLFFYAQETEVGPQTEFDHNFVSTNILSKRRQGKYLSIVISSVGNAVDQKIC